MRIEGPFLPPVDEAPCEPDDIRASVVNAPSEAIVTIFAGGGLPPEDIPVYGSMENRLEPELRAVAALRDPVAILARAAQEHYPADGDGATRRADRFADLAVTGRATFAILQDLDSVDLQRQVEEGTRILLEEAGTSVDPRRLDRAVDAVLDRAFEVAWALRGPVSHRTAARPDLGWIAVSGEDDAPHRPVNVASARWPQFDVPLTVDGHHVVVRVLVASMREDYEPEQTFDARALPEEHEPWIPNEEDVLLFIHGHSSRVEEAVDLIPELQAVARSRAHPLCVVALDLPSCGYSGVLEHQDVGHIDLVRRWDDRYPILEFYEETVNALVEALDSVSPVKERIAAVVGGSLGGNLALRFAERRPLPEWLRAIIPWSAASVWESFEGSGDILKAGTLETLEGKALETEESLSRNGFFTQAFDGNQNFLGIEVVPPQPEMWYSDAWPCKDATNAATRRQRQETYNPLFRRWHWRVAYEQLVFSHRNAVPGSGGRPYYRRVILPTLLLAGEHDNFNFAHIHDASRDMARDMMSTRTSRGVFLRATGHSIHNERPRYLALEMVSFLRTLRTEAEIHRTATVDLRTLHVTSEADERSNVRPDLRCRVIAVSGSGLQQDGPNGVGLVGEADYLLGAGTHATLGFGNSYPGLDIDVPESVVGEARTAELRPIPVHFLGYDLLFPAVHVTILSLTRPTGEGRDTRISAFQLFNHLLRDRFNGFMAHLSLATLFARAHGLHRDGVNLQEAFDRVVADAFRELQERWNGDGPASLRSLSGPRYLYADELLGIRAVIRTERELIAEGYSHELTPEEGRFHGDPREYHLRGSISLTRRRIPVDRVPEDRRLQVTGIRTRFSFTDDARSERDSITHLGGTSASGTPWILTKGRAVALVQAEERSFFVRQADGDETDLILGLHPRSRNYYLRTEPNETSEDNLYSLPELSFFLED